MFDPWTKLGQVRSGPECESLIKEVLGVCTQSVTEVGDMTSLQAGT